MNSTLIDEAIKKLFKEDYNNYIFVYSPPKVGSTTLVSSLRFSLGKTYAIIHIHDEVMLNVLTGINGIKINDIIKYLDSIGKNIYVFDIYRTPIERKISEYFEKISSLHFNNSDDKIITYPLSLVINRFNNLFNHLENGDHYLDNYNIDTPICFDFVKKYSIQIINNIKYIKLRLMDSKLWNKQLEEIFGQPITIINDYKTEDKSIGNYYKLFKEKYKIPVNYLNIIKENKYLNYYLNETEKNDYINNWELKKDDKIFNGYNEENYKLYLTISLENQKNDIIEINHYKDDGCYCSLCEYKRLLIKKNNNPFDLIKINHNEINNELINKKKITKLKLLNNLKKHYSKNKKYDKNKFKLIRI